MSFEFSDRITQVEPSATLSIKNRTSELQADGVDVIDLSVGEPDFSTPEPIVDAAMASLAAGDHGYTPTNGIAPLRSAIAEYLGDLGLTYSADQIIVTPGAKQALYETIQTVIDTGDEVVLLDPAWVSYEAMVKLADGSLNRVNTAPHDFALEPVIDELAATVTTETSLLIVNTPSNPAGAVYSESALAALRDIAVDHDLTVISDEIYREIVYETAPPPLASLDGMFERTVTINGFSKAFAMTGWRLGYLAAPSAVINQAGKLHSHSVSCAANFVQHAGVTALEEVDTEIDEMVSAFKSRRDLLIELLADHGRSVPAPAGAFYLMLPVDENDAAWCERAIDEAHVATVPGHAFGTPGYARLSYAADAERLEQAIERLAAADLL